MKRDPNLCQFVFCPLAWTKLVKSATEHEPHQIRPVRFCDKHAAPYIAVQAGKKVSGYDVGLVIVLDRREVEKTLTP
jgi:hypothetical protein